MALTEPIRNKEALRKLAEHFLSRGQYRNHLLLIIGSHTALRISDILRLKWSDVREESGLFRSHLTLTEEKTGKLKTLALHPKVVEALCLYLPYKRGKFLFAGNRADAAAITRSQAWRILRDAAKDAGLGVKCSAHALRKTFGYHAWKEGQSPVVLMDIYNHTSYGVTRRYLGVTQDDKDEVYLGIKLF